MPVLLIIMIPATALGAIWLLLLSRVVEEDWVAAAFCKVLDNREAIEKAKQKVAANQEILAFCHSPATKIMQIFLGGGKEKKIQKLEEQSQTLQQGNLRSVSLFPMPGYVLQRWIPSIGMGSIHKSVLEKCLEIGRASCRERV